MDLTTRPLRPTVPSRKGSPIPFPEWPDNGGAHNDPPVTPAQTRAMLVVRRIYCSCTTESSHDEVYYLLGGVNGSGAQVSYRGPNATQSADADNATAWDLNDSGDLQDRRLNATIYDQPLTDGQTATIALAFAESDGQDWGSTVSAAGKLAGTVGTMAALPVVSIAGAVIGLVGSFIPKNQDDALGAISLRIANRHGTVTVDEVAVGAYSAMTQGLNQSAGTFSVRFRHDDGDYLVDFQVRGR